jgi:hypothetical protein
MTVSVLIYNHGPGVLEVSNRDRDAEGKFMPQSDPVRVAPRSCYTPSVWKERDLVLESQGTEYFFLSLSNELGVEVTTLGKNDDGEFEVKDLDWYNPGQYDERVLFSGQRDIIEEDAD